MAFSETLSNICIVVASGTAIYGIRAWKREFRGKRQIELAEEALALFYEAREVIANARSCLGFASEGKTRKPEPEETPRQKGARDRAYAIFERLEPHEELFSKLHAMRYRFMAQFGVDAAKPFDELRGIRNEIFSAARRLARLWAEDERDLDETKREAHYERIRKYESVFWDTYDDATDPITPRVEQVVSEVEAICRPVIMNKGYVSLAIRKLCSKVHRHPDS